MFFGAGSPHLEVDFLIRQLMKLYIHFCCETSMGLKLKVSIEALAVELRVSSQPYNNAALSTKPELRGASWFLCGRSAVISKLRFISGAQEYISLPRKNDSWLMNLFATKSFTEDELCKLNRVRLHQQVLFLSCVLGALGKMMDRKYPEKRRDNKLWSKVKLLAKNLQIRSFSSGKQHLDP